MKRIFGTLSLLFGLTLSFAAHAAPDVMAPYWTELRRVEAVNGKKSQEVAHAWDEMATEFMHQRRFTQAEAAFNNALTIRSEVFGDFDIMVAVSYVNLAGLYIEQDKFDRVESATSTAINILQAASKKQSERFIRDIISIQLAQAESYRASAKMRARLVK